MVSTGHPRTCGGTQIRHALRGFAIGSSPHLRGNPTLRVKAFSPSRVIPAPAGEPDQGIVAGYDRPGHPRTCGGTCPESNGLVFRQGSSPHLRGLAGTRPPRRGGARSIPAPAGSGDMLRRRTTSRWVYPRPCGVWSALDGVPNYDSGLSPPLRGLDTYIFSWTLAFGSIPAPAGSGAVARLRLYLARVYPRPCGVWTVARSIVDQRLGLSPPLRGLAVVGSSRCICIGSIPAPAGSGPNAPLEVIRGWVYPRPCGVWQNCFIISF